MEHSNPLLTLQINPSMVSSIWAKTPSFVQIKFWFFGVDRGVKNLSPLQFCSGPNRKYRPPSCCWLSSEDFPLFLKVAVGNTCMDRESGLLVTSAVLQLRINISTLEASTKTTAAQALCRTLYCLFFSSTLLSTPSIF